MATRESFLTEHQLLEAYYDKRKSRPGEKIFLKGLCSEDFRKVPRPGGIIFSRSLDSEDFRKVPRPANLPYSGVTDKLTHIVDNTIFAPGGVEQDSPGDSDVIQRLVELLKDSADELNEKIMRDHELLGLLQNCFSYTVFENVASAFIHSVVPASEQKTQIAWTFEMTSRLRALDLQPMNRVMGFGAQYLHQHFAPWVQQHGGWEEAFKSDESDDEVK